MDDTKGLILATVFVTAVAAFIKQVSGNQPATFRTYLGASLMGIFLTGIGMVNARLARNFAILIILSVLLKNGGALFTFTSQATAKPKQQKG